MSLILGVLLVFAGMGLGFIFSQMRRDVVSVDREKVTMARVRYLEEYSKGLCRCLQSSGSGHAYLANLIKQEQQETTKALGIAGQLLVRSHELEALIGTILDDGQCGDLLRQHVTEVLDAAPNYEEIRSMLNQRTGS